MHVYRELHQGVRVKRHETTAGICKPERPAARRPRVGVARKEQPRLG